MSDNQGFLDLLLKVTNVIVNVIPIYPQSILILFCELCGACIGNILLLDG